MAAFAEALLAGDSQAGVWFPEEKEAVRDRRAVLKHAAQGCSRFELNKPAWALESKVDGIGLFYW